MYLNEFKDFSLLKPTLAANTDKLVKSLDLTTEDNFNIDEINEKLGKGDKNVLRELDAQGISYVLSENDSGYTVKYSYEGTNYTIFYNAPAGDETEPASDKLKDAFNQSIDKYNFEIDESEPEEPDEPIEAVFVFDYTGVNKDAVAADLYNEDNIYSDKGILKQAGDVDSGAWDDVFKELEKMKPQLLDYIKSRMELRGLTYDAGTAEKYLNVFITQAVNQLPVNGKMTHISIYNLDVPENATIEDLVNAIQECINGEFGEETKDPSVFTKVNKLDGPFNEIDPTYSEDHYLTDVADYFLTDEEKELKFVMEVVDNEYSSYGTADKDQLLKYIDTYAKHVKKVLQKRYPNLSESIIDARIMFIKTTMSLPEPDKNGVYSIDETLKNFEKQCLEDMKKHYSE